MEEGLLDDARKRFPGAMYTSMVNFEEIFVLPYEDNIPAIAHAYALVHARDHPCGRVIHHWPAKDRSHFWGLTKIPVKRNPL